MEQRNSNSSHHQLIEKRDLGGLIYPSSGLCKLLAHAETVFRSYMAVNSMGSRFSSLFLKIAVMTKANTLQILQMEQHALETQSGVTNHHELLVGKVIDIFYRLRCQQICKLHNSELHKVSMRQHNNHMTLFNGQ